MSLYESLRFKGIVKKEYREIFEPIALEGRWEESKEPGLRDFGDYPEAYRFPMSLPSMVERWEKEPWQTSYNKQTGEWIFEAEVNARKISVYDFLYDIVLFYMESAEHIETWDEEWEYHDGSTRLEKFEEGHFIGCGWFLPDGTFVPKVNRFSYPAVFTYAEGEEISVTFPDLDVSTSGENEQDALASAHELLECVLQGLLEDGKELPSSTGFIYVKKEPDEKVFIITAFL